MAAKKTSEVAEVAEVAEVVPAQTVSDSTLDQTPARALTFLRGAIRVEIARLLAGAGYGEADHTEGWTLLHAASGYSPDDAPDSLLDALPSEEVKAAVAFVDAFDEDGFRRTTAALRRYFPALKEFVMNGLTAKRGLAAIIDVRKFLDRLDALEFSPERKATRKTDHAALALLEKRGITKVKRDELRAAIQTAQSFKVTLAKDERTTEALEAAKKEASIKLRAWYEDWSETARSVVKRRDYLIALGLAQRQSRAEDESPTPGVVPLVVTAPPKPAKRRRKRK